MLRKSIQLVVKAKIYVGYVNIPFFKQYLPFLQVVFEI